VSDQKAVSLPILTLILLAIWSVLGCRTSAPLPEAARATGNTDKVGEGRAPTLTGSGTSFVPPPRAISDITAILDQQKREKPEIEAEARRRADQPPPDSQDPAVLAAFYFERAGAARKVGRSRQAIDDLTLAADLVVQAPGKHGLEMKILWRLYGAQVEAGRYTRAVAVLLRARERATPGQRGWLFSIDSDLVQQYVFAGQLDAAEAMRREVVNLREEARHWRDRPPPGVVALWDARTFQAQAGMLEGRGRYVEAEAFTRRSIAVLIAGSSGRRSDDLDPGSSRSDLLDVFRARLARELLMQGRLLEAEVEARRALLDALGKYGRYSSWTAHIGRWLSLVLLTQGRYAETETLSRALMEIYEKTGASEEASINVSSPRQFLAAALAFQGRWAEALREYDALQKALGDQRVAGYLRADPNFALALIEGGRPDEAARMLTEIIDSKERQLAAAQAPARAGGRGPQPGQASAGRGGRGRGAGGGNAGPSPRSAIGSAGSGASGPGGEAGLQAGGQVDLKTEVARATAEYRALRAMAYVAQGDRARALAGFADAVPILLDRALDPDEEAGQPAMVDERLALILTAYIRLLAEVSETPLERQAGIDATAEAFRIADVARGQQVQRALDASAARSGAKTPALAELVRQEQDTRKAIGALSGALVNQLSLPAQEQDADAVANLRSELVELQRSRHELSARIAREFPAYARLVNPPPLTIDQVRAVLRPGEALLSTYVTPDRTFVWALPRSGPVAFATAPVGTRTLAESVAELRRSLDPSALAVGDIPAFDVQRSHELFRQLLEPVGAGWRGATSLLVIAHGPLAQLPFSVLVTRDVTLRPDPGTLFSGYRDVAWLARSHAITVLPSATSLVTLRALPAGDARRHPFVGFGDPYFSEEQARSAARRETATPAAAESVATRGGLSLVRRRAPTTEGVTSSELAQLPPLPETAEEIRSIARAVHADPTTDVFLGARANEQTVRSLDLARYRVLAFATHGLVPGELDGLTQPALALSAPAVAKVDGDGLLTMEKILGLRLNADWVVLSACNTASGSGAGSEAVSGLGRAFFYAGARALLVSNWPVETSSAKTLITELFRRQQAEPGLTRAQALQQTMTWLLDGQGATDPRTGGEAFTYAHPLFWAPFTLVGDGGGDQ
jgi:CHAT domain-containing protein/tetratricopeptide (TPR) repeat protein